MLGFLLAAISLLVPFSIANEYYVTSKANRTDCPSEGLCQPLSFYTENSSYYFHDDVVFLFLEGTHLLERSLFISGVSNISLLGWDGSGNLATTFPALITCLNGTGRIVFYGHSTDILIKFLAINNCNRTLVFYEVFTITLDHLIVTNSTGYGLLMINVYGAKIHYSSFSFSGRANAFLYFTSPHHYCFPNAYVFNVSIESSTFSSGRWGLFIAMNQLSTYHINTVVDSVITCSNSEYNIVFTMLDGHPHSLDLINVSSYGGSYGLVIHAEKYNTRHVCSSLIDTVDVPANVNIIQSDISNNEQGILSLVDLGGKISLQVQITGSTLYGNRIFALSFDKEEEDTVVLRIKESEILNNSFSVGIEAALTTPIFIYRHDVYMEDVVIGENMNTGLVLVDSKVTFSGSNNVFINNINGINGGAIALFHSDIILTRNTTISFINNTANRKGGAIYIDQVCALQIIDDQSNKTLNNITLIFVGNLAQNADDIYGLTSPLHCNINLGNLEDTVDFYTDDELFSFSTDSVGVCSCVENDSVQTFSECYNRTFNKSEIIKMSMSKHPGELLVLPIAIVGYGGKKAYSLTDGVIDLFVNGQKVTTIPYNGTYCYELQHMLIQQNPEAKSVEILIESEPNYLNILTSSTYPAIGINVMLLPCPEGFQLVNGVCNCIEILQNTSVVCDITTEEITVTRTGPVWYGTMNNHSCYITDTICGYDYCVDGTITFTLVNNNDMQCNSHRSGLLCSQCSKGKSLKLGSNECGNCNNSFVAMIILFFFAGIGLIGLIIMLNLTVSVGTINGLIFYANILKMYEHIFFPNGPIPFVSQFISWINLDFGFNICFYDGMDTYSKAWLQFVFPFYIWTLIVIIIVLCHWSMKLSKLFGSHVVPALATLLLLSYIKLMRSIVYALNGQHIYISCNSGNSINELRWYPDPNIRYLERKHAFLFVFALFLLILLVIPYTIVLLLSPVLQGYISRYRLCSIWNKLKPVFDAYNAPFKDRLRFWTGFLLVARLPILAAVSATNLSETDKNALLSVVLSMIAVVLTVGNVCGGVYRIWYLNVLESSFLLNLAMVTIAAINETSSHTYKGFLITSICISFILFTGLIIFHVYLRFSKGGSRETELKMQALAKGLLAQKKAEVIKREKKLSSIQSTDEELSEMEGFRSRVGSTLTELRRRESLLLDNDDNSSDYVFVTD